MNLLHISDMHFGSRHWTGNSKILLEKLNSYSADIIINTGDNTTDSLESEFEDAGKFLDALKCKHVISIVGNHDKRTMRCRDFYQAYIDEIDVIQPVNSDKCSKRNIFLDEHTSGITENFTDINFIQNISLDDVSLLIVCLDTNELNRDNGYIDREMLRSVSLKIEQHTYNKIILLNHHSILDSDSDPLFNSRHIIDFVTRHKIEHVFCGHTHQLALSEFTDLYHQHSFRQYKNGSLSSCNSPSDSNMFLFFENFGEKNMTIRVVRIFIDEDQLSFKEEIISIS